MGALLQNTIFGRTKNSFISVWTTSNVSEGSSLANQIKLPLINSGNYNFIVDWGDGLTNIITAWNNPAVTHTYSTAGTYTIKIKGTLIGWQFDNIGDRLKLLSISQWGKIGLGNKGSYFKGCSNLNLSNVNDILCIEGTSNFSNIFSFCTSLTTVKNINHWDMSKVTNLATAFIMCINFDQDLSSWNVSSVTSFWGLFQFCSKFNNGGNSNINNWNTESGNNFSYMFDGATNFHQPINSWNTSNVTNTMCMFSNANSFNHNIGNWDLSNVTSFDSMFKNAVSFNNGGNNSINNWNTSSVTSMIGTFNGAKSFNQNIGGWNVGNVKSIDFMFMEAIKFNNGGSSEINNWNTSKVTSMIYTFYNADFFNQNIGNWNLSNTTNISYMFSSAVQFNNGGSTDINNWNTSNVTDMSYTFYNAKSFNQNIGDWNVSNVTSISNMFAAAIIFNNGGSNKINKWDTSKITTMSALFYATYFNQPLDGWNVGNVQDMSRMFHDTKSFNQNIGKWDVSNVSVFNFMFNDALAFNNGGSPDINNWTLKTTGSVSLNGMFQGGGGDSIMIFNQPIGNWNTSAVTNMSNMFHKTGNGHHYFNQPIGNWNTSNVTNMSNMFRQGGTNGGAFNQNIGAWDVSNVSDFSEMFLGAKQFDNGGSPTINNWNIKTTGSVNMSKMFANINRFNLTTFNQPIGNWNTSAVTNMDQMFGATEGSVAFNQDIGNWDVSNVINFSNFMIGKSSSNFSTSNLDSIYNGWSSRPVKTAINISFGAVKRSPLSDAGKAILAAAPNNWIITDGGIETI